jgi:hypothetical protein
MHQAGFAGRRVRSGAVRLIQRFSSAPRPELPLPHAFPDGVYFERPDGALTLRSREGADGRRAHPRWRELPLV